MKNVFVTQFPAITIDPDEVLDAIDDKSVLTSRAWNVWPFLATIKHDEDDVGEEFTKIDKDGIFFMKYVLLAPIKRSIENGEFDQTVRNLHISLKQKCTPNSLTVMKQTLLSFRTIFSLCLAATYAKIFYGEGEGWRCFLETWENEIGLVCDKDEQYRRTYGTEGLICKNPRELVAVFLKIFLAKTLSSKGNRGSIFEFARHVSKGAISNESLQAIETILMGEIGASLELMKGFLAEQN